MRLEKKFSKGKSFRKNLVADYSETPEDLERIKRKSKAVAQQAARNTHTHTHTHAHTHT